MTTADNVSVDTARVLAELAFFVGKGVQKATGARLNVFDTEAREYWVDKHLKSIPIALARAAKKGETFDDHRSVVTAEAKKLGRIAAELALADDPTGNPVVIKLEHVKEASKRVNEGEACQAASTAGGGGYCES
jgi:hypothetical protein